MKKKIEHEIKIAPISRVQIKLLSSLRNQNVDTVGETLKQALGIGDFELRVENIINRVDDYYDTDDLALFHTHSSLRVRREGGMPKITIKTLIGQSQGELRRSEFEKEFTEFELKKHISEGFEAIVKEEIPDYSDKKFKLVLKVLNERQNFAMNRGPEKYQLSLDVFSYTNPINNGKSEQFFEIEIESLNEQGSLKLSKIKRNLLGVLNGFTYSNGSKYERGINTFSLQGSKWRKALSDWNTGLGLNWLSIFLGVIGLILGFFGIWLTLRTPAG